MVMLATESGLLGAAIKGSGFLNKKWPYGAAIKQGCHHLSSYNIFSSINFETPCSTQALLPERPLANTSTCTSPTVKRKVAMWVGYVGTLYKGLQMQRNLTDGQTIEEELERAIYKAGGILDSNFGHLEKIGWMRSSRTDKGVHSLSTVISLKLEVTNKTWENDPDGIALADSINLHLPHTIRIFGIVPVNKSFDPRRGCISRTYHYLLPAEVLGITKNSSLQEVQHVCSDFQSLLALFQGRHPFHNYTARAQYRKSVTKTAGYHSRKHDSLKAPRDSNDSDDIEETVQDMHGISDSYSDISEVYGIKERVSISMPRAHWQAECDVLDKIETSHFRRILSFKCEGVESFDNVLFLRISVQGESFMLHQIRKMVATAIAVMHNVLPKELIPISLSQKSRIVLPIAPSQGLILAKNEFFPFRTCNNHSKTSEKIKDLPRLKMSSEVVTRVGDFSSNVVLPEVAPLLDCSNPIWSKWLENLCLSRIPEEDFSKVHTAWNESREQANLSMLMQDTA